MSPEVEDVLKILGTQLQWRGISGRVIKVGRETTGWMRLVLETPEGDLLNVKASECGSLYTPGADG